MLIVDSGMAPLLAAGWQDVAAQAMRNPNILFHDRKTFRLLVVREAVRDWDSPPRRRSLACYNLEADLFFKDSPWPKTKMSPAVIS